MNSKQKSNTVTVAVITEMPSNTWKIFTHHYALCCIQQGGYAED
jgi:hypothetical protein